jgi:UDP-N-acetylmuramoyl-L-alanyl-D-glutamate--2,6-diaminopimelate ligase
VLTALRPHVRGNLSVIFGCGGDRDPGKRPLMGAAAHDHADVVWLTDDNPRSEVPADIRAAARSGCPNATEIADRGAAIAAAISALAGHDVLVITGKGHEQGQIIGDQVIPFDDATVARQAALSLGGKVIGVAA